MAQMPYMKLFWPDFFGDERVQAMTAEGKGIYLLLLGVMWNSGGWIAADDKVIAKRLGLNVRAWRARYRPEIEPLMTEFTAPLIGSAWTQKRLEKELAKANELRAKRIANLGMTEVEYEAKRTLTATKPAAPKQPASSRDSSTRERRPPHARPIAHSSEDTTYPVTLDTRIPAAGRAAAADERSAPPPHNVDAAALPPRELPAMPTPEAEPSSNPETVKRLVADGLKRPGGKPPSLSDLMAELTKGK